MDQIDRATRILSVVVDVVVGLLFAGMAVLVILLVILRYFFSSSIPGGFEALRFAFIYTTFLGAAVLVGRDGHISIRLLVDRLPRPARRVVDVLNSVLVAGLNVYLLVLSFEWIQVTGGFLAEELDFPMRFIKVSLPIGCGLAAIYALLRIVRTVWVRAEVAEGGDQ